MSCLTQAVGVSGFNRIPIIDGLAVVFILLAFLMLVVVVGVVPVLPPLLLLPLPLLLL